MTSSPKKPPLESAQTTAWLKRLRQRGGLWWKNHGGLYMPVGMSDIGGVYKGRSVHIEVKRPPPYDAQFTPAQGRWIKMCLEAGGVALKAYDWGTVSYALDMVDAGDREQDIRPYCLEVTFGSSR